MIGKEQVGCGIELHEGMMSACSWWFGSGLAPSYNHMFFYSKLLSIVFFMLLTKFMQYSQDIRRTCQD